MRNHHPPHRFAPFFLLAAVLLSFTPAPVYGQTPPQTETPPYVPGELLVGLDIPASARLIVQAQALGNEIGAAVMAAYGSTVVFHIDPGADLTALAEQVRSMDGVRFAEPNYFYNLPDDPTDHAAPPNQVPLRSMDGLLTYARAEDLLQLSRGPAGRTPTYPGDGFNNWGFAWSGASIVWTEKSPSPAVCLIDSGVEVNHPDLKGRVINGYDFVNHDNLPGDDHGHGTHSAGVIAASPNNKLGLAGISNGKVIAVKAVNAQGKATAEDVARSIRYCADHAQTRVILVNVVGPVSQALYQELDYAIRTRGRLVVAPAGDDGTASTALAYPAAWASTATPAADGQTNLLSAGLISVTAAAQQTPITILDEFGSPVTADRPYCRARSANYGSWVDLAAPGESIYSTLPAASPFMLQMTANFSPGYGVLSGSSTAAAHAAAAAARTWSLHAGRPYPLWTAAQVKDRLKQTGSPVDHSGSSGGEDTACWPESSTDTTYLNLARAMNRGGLYLKIQDAQSGLPLKDAVVNVHDCLTVLTACDRNGPVRDSGKITSLVSPEIHLINLPVYAWDAAGNDRSDAVTHEKLALNYNLAVQRSGYTTGLQVYERSISILAGDLIGHSYFNLAVPPARGTHIVLTWDGPPDFDLELWLPADQPDRITRLNPGSLWGLPQARYFRDGGSNTPQKGDALRLETITINNKPGTAIPMLLTNTNFYAVTVKVDGLNGSAFLDPTVNPFVRVWDNGMILLMPDQTTRFKPVMASCAAKDLWHSFNLMTGLKQVAILTRDQCRVDQPEIKTWPSNW